MLVGKFQPLWGFSEGMDFLPSFQRGANRLLGGEREGNRGSIEVQEKLRTSRGLGHEQCPR